MDIRTTISLPQETREYLEYVAERENQTLSVVVKQMIGRGLLIEKFLESGHAIITRSEDGKEQLLADGQMEMVSKTPKLPKKT